VDTDQTLQNRIWQQCPPSLELVLATSRKSLSFVSESIPLPGAWASPPPLLFLIKEIRAHRIKPTYPFFRFSPFPGSVAALPRGMDFPPFHLYPQLVPQFSQPRIDFFYDLCSLVSLVSREALLAQLSFYVLNFRDLVPPFFSRVAASCEGGTVFPTPNWTSVTALLTFFAFSFPRCFVFSVILS